MNKVKITPINLPDTEELYIANDLPKKHNSKTIDLRELIFQSVDKELKGEIISKEHTTDIIMQFACDKCMEVIRIMAYVLNSGCTKKLSEILIEAGFNESEATNTCNSYLKV